MSTSRDSRRGAGMLLKPLATNALTGAILALAASAASADITYGAPIQIGDGNARTYIVTNGDVPIELGLAVDQAFLEALPADGDPGGMVMPDGRSTFEYVLEMPPGNGTPFQHVTLDWNPSGHEPDGVYDHPHLDVHFYVVSNDERLAIHPADPDFAGKGGRLPDPAFMPTGYVDPGIPPVPMMGLHLVDPASPELHPHSPATFTHTFLYGSWDGRMIFLEPMVTTDFLQMRQEVLQVIPVAEQYDPPGYYPGAYGIRWDDAAEEYRIALTDLYWR